MEIMQVVGKRSMKFKGNDGTEISGTNLYVVYDDNYTEGKKTDKLFISDHLRSNLSFFPKVGDEICVDFNRWGKISNITSMP